MGHIIENNCVSCEHCINCGRREQETYFCDDCGDYADNWNPLYRLDDKELCWDCYKAQYTEKICDDMDETKCAHCGNEAEYMYLVDGDWVCEDCLKEMAERVDME